MRCARAAEHNEWSNILCLRTCVSSFARFWLLPALFLRIFPAFIFRSQVTQAGTKIAVMRFYVRFYYILRGYRCGLDGVELWGGGHSLPRWLDYFFLDLVGSMVRHLWGQVEPATRRTLAVRAMV